MRTINSHSVRVAFVALTVALFTGCESVKAPTALATTASAAAPATSAATTTVKQHVDCSKTEEGCWKMRALRFKYEPAHPVMKSHSLNLPYTTEAERSFRAQDLGPVLWEEYRKGTVAAHKAAGTVDYMVFGAEDVPLGNFKAYRVNGKNILSAIPVAEITGQVPYPDLSRNGKVLGKPRIFRLRAEGDDPVGVELVVPWTLFGPGSTVLVCSGEPVVYPPTASGSPVRYGLEVAPESLAWLKAKNSRRGLLVFLF